jgi:hypothetical protein
MWYSAVGSIVTPLVSLLAVPLAAPAPLPGQVYRIGYLGTTPPPAHQWEALLDGLRERGYHEGRNVVFERRFPEGHAERFPEFAAKLVQMALTRSAELGRRVSTGFVLQELIDEHLQIEHPESRAADLFGAQA